MFQFLFGRKMFFLCLVQRNLFLIFIIILKIYTINLNFRKLIYFSFLNCGRTVLTLLEIQLIFFELNTSSIRVLRVPVSNTCVRYYLKSVSEPHNILSSLPMYFKQESIISNKNI